MKFNREELEQMRASADIDGLVEVLQSGDDKLRDVAAEMLGECGDERCVEPLIHMLREGRFGYLRGAAARALGQLKTAEAVPALMETLNDDIYHTRAGAVKALGQIGDERALDALIDMLKETREYIRGMAADAIKGIGNGAIDNLIRFIHKDHGRGVDIAVILLGKIGDSRAVEVLEGLAQKHHEKYVRETAGKAVAAIRARL